MKLFESIEVIRKVHEKWLLAVGENNLDLSLELFLERQCLIDVLFDELTNLSLDNRQFIVSLLQQIINDDNVVFKYVQHTHAEVEISLHNLARSKKVNMLYSGINTLDK